MKKILYILTLLLYGIVFPRTVFAATYYVSNAGNDANPGTQSLPWAHCPGVAGWTGSKNLVSGDIVYFDNGGVWQGPTSGNTDFIKLKTAGITLDGSSWGNGTRATFKAMASDYYTGIMEILAGNITIRGFNIDGNAKNNYGIWINGNPGDVFQNVSGIVIDNCLIHDNGMTDTWGIGLHIGSANNYTTSGVQILNCKIYNTPHSALTIYPDNSTAYTGNHVSNVLIRGVEMYNSGTMNANFGFGMEIKNWVTNAVIEYSYIHNNPQNGITTSYNNPAGHPNTGIVMRYNVFKDNGSFGWYHMPQETYAGNYEVDFYGNLLINNGKSGWAGGGILFESGRNYLSNKINIYNNTFVSTGSPITQYGFINEGTTGTPTINFRNNILYGANVLVADTSNWLNKNGSTHSNNLYFRTDSQNSTYVTSGSTNYTGTTVKSAYEPSSQNTNPNFNNVFNLPAGFIGTYGIDMAPITDGLSIGTGNAVDHGANIGTTYNGAINLTGRSGGLTRPQGGGFDIGAYEFVSGESPSPIPGDLNGDGHVDLFDYNELVTYFGNPYTIYDYNVLVANFGK